MSARELYYKYIPEIGKIKKIRQERDEAQKTYDGSKSTDVTEKIILEQTVEDLDHQAAILLSKLFDNIPETEIKEFRKLADI